MQRNPYLFDNAAEAETAERFASLDALYNFRTFRFLETTGIGPGWRCLEVGGGSGSVAAWMADRVGPSGYVLVTDIDPRFMEGSAYRRPAHMELRRHDIGTDPLPEQAFDLIHARLVLMHVPRRLRRARQACGRVKAPRLAGDRGLRRPRHRPDHSHAGCGGGGTLRARRRSPGDADGRTGLRGGMGAPSLWKAQGSRAHRGRHGGARRGVPRAAASVQASMPRTSPKCAGRPSPRDWSRTPRSTPCWRVSTHRILRSSRS